MKKIFLTAIIMLQGIFYDMANIQAAEYELTLNLPIPPIHSRWHNAIKPWFDELQDRSGGRITVEPFFAEAISKTSESMDSVRDGLADFTESAFTMAPGKFPFYERVFDVVDAGRSLEGDNAILHQMEKEFPQIAGETEGVKMILTHALPIGMLIGTKEPVTKLEDLKDKKIAVIGGATSAEALKALGASVVNIPTIDIYMALQQGIIDGSMVDFQLLTSRRFGDLIKNVTVLPINANVFYMAMNKDVYDSMPEDLKKIIDDMSGEYAQKKFEDFWMKDQMDSLEKWLNEMGGHLYVLSDEEYAKANELLAPNEQKWIELVGQNGLPAQDMLKRFRELEKIHNPVWKKSMLSKYFENSGN